jgi:hypothetical protein
MKEISTLKGDLETLLRSEELLREDLASENLEDGEQSFIRDGITSNLLVESGAIIRATTVLSNKNWLEVERTPSGDLVGAVRVDVSMDFKRNREFADRQARATEWSFDSDGNILTESAYWLEGYSEYQEKPDALPE